MQGFCLQGTVRGIIRARKRGKVHARTSHRRTRDPEDREIDECDPVEKKDKMMDKTVADTFPASDPPSSIPDPDEDSFAATECK
jgi:hypothetical protein